MTDEFKVGVKYITKSHKSAIYICKSVVEDTDYGPFVVLLPQCASDGSDFITGYQQDFDRGDLGGWKEFKPPPPPKKHKRWIVWRRDSHGHLDLTIFNHVPNLSIGSYFNGFTTIYIDETVYTEN